MTFPFKEVNKILSETTAKFNNINCGGCGVVAYILARQLRKQHETKIVIYGWSNNSNSIRNARRELSKNSTLAEWHRADLDLCHAWVEFKIGRYWYGIDSAGVHKRRKMHSLNGVPAKGELTLGEMQGMINSADGWNSRFRRNQIQPMKRYINGELNKLFGVKGLTLSGKD